MSRLQELINKLVQIIVSYNETQTNKTIPPESFSNKSPEELHQFLQKMITEATKVYKTRGSLLTYFLFVVDTIKPLVDRKTSLMESEQQSILQTLQSLLNTINLLLKTSHNIYISVSYDNSIIKIPGFIRGVISSSLCNTGQIISRELADALNDSSKGYMDKLILDHQSPLLEIERLGNVIIVMQTEAQNFKILIAQQQKEIASLKIPNLKLVDDVAMMESRIEAKEKQSAFNVEENISQQKKLFCIEDELNSARKENKLQAEEIILLKNEIKALKNTNKSLYGNMDSHSLFAHKPLFEDPDTARNYIETRKTPSPSGDNTCLE